MCGHSSCRHTAFKETPTYQLHHSNADQAKHIKVGIPVLLHRIVIKVSRNYIKKLDRTETTWQQFRQAPHEEKSVRSKKERFHLWFHFFCNRQRQAQRTRKVWLPVLLHHKKSFQDCISKLNVTEKHDSSFGRLYMKKGGSLKKKRFSFLFQSSMEGGWPPKPPVHTPLFTKNTNKST